MALACGTWAGISLTALPASAQTRELPSLEAGDKIRVWSERVPLGELTGRLVRLNVDTLFMTAADSGLGWYELPVGSLRRFEVSRGKNKWVVLGGAALGAAVGALAGAALPSESQLCDQGFGDIQDCDQVLSDAVVGAAAGAIILGVVAASATPERWERVPLERLIEIELGMRGWGEFRAGLRLWF